MTMTLTMKAMPPRIGGPSRGHSLIEAIVAVVIMGVITSFGVPRFTRSLEQARVDVAAANLRAIWVAERLYWLKHQSYADGLATLVSDPADGENFLDRSLLTAGSNGSGYTYQVDAADAASFTASASRERIELLVREPVDRLRRGGLGIGPERQRDRLPAEHELPVNQSLRVQATVDQGRRSMIRNIEPSRPSTRRAAGPSASAFGSRRGGYTMIEVMLAFAVLGIALAGLFPFVLAHLKLTRKLEVRFQGQVSYDLDASGQNSIQVLPNSQYPAQTYYVGALEEPPHEEPDGRGLDHDRSGQCRRRLCRRQLRQRDPDTDDDL